MGRKVAKRTVKMPGKKTGKKTGKKIDKRMVLFMLLCMVVCLTACIPEVVSQPEKKTVLQLWHYWGSEDARHCLASLIQKFNETHEEIEIQANYIADEDFKKRLILAAAEGKLQTWSWLILRISSITIRQESYRTCHLISVRKITCLGH